MKLYKLMLDNKVYLVKAKSKENAYLKAVVEKSKNNNKDKEKSVVIY